MTKDTQILAKVCRSELIVSCDAKSIEAAWLETQRSIDKSVYFSYTLEPIEDGRTRLVLWPFSVQSNDKLASYVDLQMLDLPNVSVFIEETFLPFKKRMLKKLCVLCLTRFHNQDPLKVVLMVDSRAGKEKDIILKKAYEFCAVQFRDAYISADARTFTPARIMDEISMSLADKLL